MSSLAEFWRLSINFLFFRQSECNYSWYSFGFSLLRVRLRSVSKPFGSVSPRSSIFNKDMDKKVCGKCKIDKELEDFSRDKSKSDGFSIHCRLCRNSYKKEYNSENKQKVGFRRRRYYLDNKEKFKSLNVKYRKRYRERINAYRRDRGKLDSNFRLIRTVRNRTLAVLKKGLKSASTIKLLGVSIDEVRSHLESKFKPGMTWENHGLYGWHIDHIRPCSSFDLTDLVQQKLCFHYSNLQPLWAKDNLSKGDKWIKI